LRFGGGTMPRYLSYVNLTNFGGTFTFAGQDPLSDFAANRPSRYTVNVGNPRVSFNQYESYSFVQDEMRLRRNLSLVAGLRYEWQSNVSYHKKFAPRSEEHTSELQSRGHLVCRLLLEKKKLRVES